MTYTVSSGTLNLTQLQQVQTIVWTILTYYVEQNVKPYSLAARILQARWL